MKRLLTIANTSVLTAAVFVATSVGLGRPAQAITFSFQEAPGTPQPVIDAMNALATDINSKFSGSPETNFIQSMAEASRGANRGIGSDGVSQTDVFSISTSAGVGLATKGSFGSFEANNGLPGVGLGVQPAVTVGINAKRFNKIATLGLDPTRVTYFLSFGVINLSDITPEAGFKIVNFGFLGRYWVKPAISPNWAFRWDGLAATSGVQYAGFTANVNSQLNFAQSVSGGGGTTNIAWNPNADFGISAKSFTIPFELRTGITLLKFWSLSAGAGALFNFGSAETTGSIAGQIKDNTNASVGTGTLDLASASQKPSLVSARFSLGTQFNFGPVKLFADAGYATPKVADLALGLRFVW